MKKIIRISALIFVCCFICNQKLFSQQAARLQYLSYVFPSDSLSGFNQAGANAAALQGGFFGIEYKVYMYREKRNYINSKYGYTTGLSFGAYSKANPTIINNAPCVNEDFEASPL